MDPEFREWVEVQLSQRPLHDEEDVTLTYAGSRRVVDWAVRKSDLADGTRPFHPVLPANRVDAAIARARAREPALLGYFERKQECVARTARGRAAHARRVYAA